MHDPFYPRFSGIQVYIDGENLFGHTIPGLNMSKPFHLILSLFHYLYLFFFYSCIRNILSYGQ